MRKMLRLGGTILLYFCVATVLAEAIIAVGLTQRWQLSRDKWMRILAIAYDVEPAADTAGAKSAEQPSVEQPSYQQLLDERAVKLRDIELREQSLRAAVDAARGEQRKLVDEKKRLKQLRSGFETQLATTRESATSSGMDEVRRTLETIKPKQAKDQLMRMMADDQMDQAVALMAGMSDNKRGKIISEFKTSEEAEKLSEVLLRLREGLPLAETADKARHQLAQPQPLTP